MSAVKRIRVKNRLAAVVRMPGGKTVAEAVAGAEAQLETIKDDCVAAVDNILKSMGEAAAPLQKAPTADGMGDLYDLSNELIGIAGIAGLGPVGDAAFSFCELLDKFMEGAAWNWQAVAVHMNGLKLLRAMGEQMGEAERDQVLDGLRAVTRRIASGDAESA